MGMNGSEGGFMASLSANWEQFLLHPLVASLVGSGGAVIYAFPGATRSAKVLNGVFSFFCGIYGGPAFNEWRTIESKRIGAVIIILAAVSGLILLNGFLEWLKGTKFADLPFIRHFIKAPSGQEGAQP